MPYTKAKANGIVVTVFAVRSYGDECIVSSHTSVDDLRVNFIRRQSPSSLSSVAWTPSSHQPGVLKTYDILITTTSHSKTATTVPFALACV